MALSWSTLIYRIMIPIHIYGVINLVLHSIVSHCVMDVLIKAKDLYIGPSLPARDTQRSNWKSIRVRKGLKEMNQFIKIEWLLLWLYRTTTLSSSDTISPIYLMEILLVLDHILWFFYAIIRICLCINCSSSSLTDFQPKEFNRNFP